EREPRELVIEPGPIERLERGHGVALLALGGEPAGVRILVAAGAAGPRAHELRLALRGGSRVTREAGDLRVAAVEAPSGERVVEALHRSARPADQLGAAADVLDVAFVARPGPVLLAVEAEPRGDLAAEVLVTVEAQPGDHLVARFVAPGAVVV